MVSEGLGIQENLRREGAGLGSKITMLLIAKLIKARSCSVLTPCCRRGRKKSSELSCKRIRCSTLRAWTPNRGLAERSAVTMRSPGGLVKPAAGNRVRVKKSGENLPHRFPPLSPGARQLCRGGARRRHYTPISSFHNARARPSTGIHVASRPATLRYVLGPSLLHASRVGYFLR